MPDLTVKTGDTFPPITATLSDAGGPVDLTTADSVRLIMKLQNGPTVVEGPCTVTDAANGEVEYEWQSGDTDEEGTYNAEFEVTWNVGEIETFPNDGYREIELQGRPRLMARRTPYQQGQIATISGKSPVTITAPDGLQLIIPAERGTARLWLPQLGTWRYQWADGTSGILEVERPAHQPANPAPPPSVRRRWT